MEPPRSDRDLLEALVTRRSDAAFEALLRRHGPMVLGVCRRVLGNVHDADDAFQATFLVLIRRAGSVRKRDALGSWLYGVAYRTAQKAHAMNARRQRRERQAARRDATYPAEPAWDLDEELRALPERYRVPVVLCELEGRPRKEVARTLAIPEGTLSSRLATAKKLLADRLRRRGWTGADAAPAVTIVPVLLAQTTARAGSVALAGRALSAVVSPQVLALCEGVVKAMLVSKLKMWSAVLLVGGTLGLGWESLPRPSAARAADDPGVEAAAAELAAATASVKRAEAQLEAARARAAAAEKVYDQVRQRGGKFDDRASVAGLASRFRFRIPVELGATEFAGDARLDILEVWGTRPQIEIGGQYLVRGRYKMPAHADGTIYFHLTASDWAHGVGPDYDLQHTRVKKGEGEFTLLHVMAGAGYFHLELVGENQQTHQTVANVYFGTGDNVLRKKTW